MSESVPDPAPVNSEACSHPVAAGSKPHLLYKCLLNQYAQKLKKPLPIYQTHNEGYEHLPKFRSTVWIDGVSYTSSNTFQQRKTAEMDVSKIALFDIMQKSKNEALHHIREDKTFCKSILVEYATKMNIEKPIYETVQLETSVPVFRSSLIFNGVTHTGDTGKSKKEAEQLAARSVIIMYLESESGNDMSDIINCKFRHYADINKVPETNNVHNGTNIVGVQTGFNNEVTSNEAKAEAGTTVMPNSSESYLGQGTTNTIPATCLPPGLTQTPIPEVSIPAITPAAPGPTVLTQVPSSGINNLPTSSMGLAPSVGQFGSFPATNVYSNVTQPANLEASSGTLEHMPYMGQTNERKRNRKNKKNAQKKMRVDNQMPIPVMPTSEVPPCSSQ